MESLLYHSYIFFSFLNKKQTLRKYSIYELSHDNHKYFQIFFACWQMILVKRLSLIVIDYSMPKEPKQLMCELCKFQQLKRKLFKDVNCRMLLPPLISNNTENCCFSSFGYCHWVCLEFNSNYVHSFITIFSLFICFFTKPISHLHRWDQLLSLL